MRLPSGQPVELDIRIDQRAVARRGAARRPCKDGQIDLIASAALVDTLSNAKSFAITLRSGRMTKVYTFAIAQDPRGPCRLVPPVRIKR